MDVIFRVNSRDAQSKLSTLIERLDLDLDQFSPFESSRQDIKINLCVVDVIWNNILPRKFISGSLSPDFNFPGSI